MFISREVDCNRALLASLAELVIQGATLEENVNIILKFSRKKNYSFSFSPWILNKRVDFEREPGRTKQGSLTLLQSKPRQAVGGLAGWVLTLVTVQALLTYEPGSALGFENAGWLRRGPCLQDSHHVIVEEHV